MLWKENKADMVFTYSFKKSRAKYLIYPKESHIHLSWNLFILKKNKDTIVYNSFNDLNGLRIGVTEDYAYTNEFWQYMNSGKLSVQKTPLDKLNMTKLLYQRVDLTPQNTIAALYKAKQNGYLEKITYLSKPIKSKPYFNTFVRGSDYPNIEVLIIKYDEELRKMKQDGRLKRILSKYGLKYN